MTGSILLLFLALVVAMAIVFGLKCLQSNDSVAELPYTRAKGLFTAAERHFLTILEQAVGDKFRVFGKVRVADVAEVKPNVDRSTWQRAFNKVCAKHFDFVLCDKATLSIACVVELDDRSHAHTQRRERDALIANICKAISLPMISVTARQEYSVSDIQTQVMTAIGSQAGA